MTKTTTAKIDDIDLSFATLNVTNNGIKAEFTKKTGGKVFKNIGLESLTKILNKNSEFDTGFMPIFGSNYIGTKRFIKSGDKEILFLEACPANRPLIFRRGENKLEGVRYPGLLMSVVCRSEPSGKITIKDSRIFATTGPILRDRDQLYKFPFGNVYDREHGRICWGTYEATVKYIKKVSQAAGLLNMFLDAEMNSDLYHGEKNLGTWLTDLNNAESFPYEDLKNDMSFSELISLVKSKSVG